MDPRHIDSARKALDEKRRALLRRLHLTVQDEVERPAERSADWMDDAISHEVERRLSDGERRTLATIERALGRIQEGSYGRCSSCGRHIDPARLQALPETDRCLRCAQPH